MNWGRFPITVSTRTPRQAQVRTIGELEKRCVDMVSLLASVRGTLHGAFAQSRHLRWLVSWHTGWAAAECASPPARGRLGARRRLPPQLAHDACGEPLV